MNKPTLRSIDSLQPYVDNSKVHPPAQVVALAASIEEFGFAGEIIVRGDTIAKGHGCLEAIKQLLEQGKRIYPIPGEAAGAKPFPLGKVPVMDASGWSDDQLRAYVVADNRLPDLGTWNQDTLRDEISRLQVANFDLGKVGFDAEALRELFKVPDAGVTAAKGQLAEKFLIPPFSVFNAREGWWQERKRAWLALGIRSEVGRGGELHKGATVDAKGGDRWEGGRSAWQNEGTSIFDPVLCEVAYRWFCPAAGHIVDPFAGGSVRGVVANHLGLAYTGMELREEQVAANIVQRAAICTGGPQPEWLVGDSRTIDKECAGLEADFLFSCPPYADLEVYSDDPADISNMPYQDFKAAYTEIVRKACSLLRPDRFACFVVSEVRGPGGNFYNFVADTIAAFEAAGLRYYNEAILVTAVGSLPTRAGRVFSASRKLGRTHQNVLVFVKGDGKRAAQACGNVETVAPNLPEAEEN